VNYVSFVDVVQGVEQLEYDVGSLFLADPLALGEVLVEVALGGEIQQKVELFAFVEIIVESSNLNLLYNVRMVEGLVHLALPHNLGVLLIEYLRSRQVNNLQSKHFLGCFVSHQFDLCKRPFSQPSTHVLHVVQVVDLEYRTCLYVHPFCSVLSNIL
jgi:hypothetical protein